MVRFALTCLVVLATLTVLGCSDSGPATVSVSGTVQLDDKPAEGLEVSFFFEPEDFLASAVTGADGGYTLKAVPGDNKVWIAKQTFSDADPAGGMDENPEMDPGQMEAMADVETPGAVEDQLPEKYSSPDKTELKFPVPEGGSDSADFKLAGE